MALDIAGSTATSRLPASRNCRQARSAVCSLQFVPATGSTCGQIVLTCYLWYGICLSYAVAPVLISAAAQWVTARVAMAGQPGHEKLAGCSSPGEPMQSSGSAPAVRSGVTALKHRGLAVCPSDRWGRCWRQACPGSQGMAPAAGLAQREPAPCSAGLDTTQV